MDEAVGVSALILIASVMVVAMHFSKIDENIAHHDSALSGREYYMEVMNSSSWRRFLNVTRMRKRCFLDLLKLLKDSGGLKDSKYVCAGEKLMIFLTLLKCIYINVSDDK